MTVAVLPLAFVGLDGLSVNGVVGNALPVALAVLPAAFVALGVHTFHIPVGRAVAVALTRFPRSLVHGLPTVHERHGARAMAFVELKLAHVALVIDALLAATMLHIVAPLARVGDRLVVVGQRAVALALALDPVALVGNSVGVDQRAATVGPTPGLVPLSLVLASTIGVGKRRLDRGNAPEVHQPAQLRVGLGRNGHLEAELELGATARLGQEVRGLAGVERLELVVRGVKHVPKGSGGRVGCDRPNDLDLVAGTTLKEPNQAASPERVKELARRRRLGRILVHRREKSEDLRLGVDPKGVHLGLGVDNKNALLVLRVVKEGLLGVVAQVGTEHQGLLGAGCGLKRTVKALLVAELAADRVDERLMETEGFTGDTFVLLEDVGEDVEAFVVGEGVDGALGGGGHSGYVCFLETLLNCEGWVGEGSNCFLFKKMILMKIHKYRGYLCI